MKFSTLLDELGLILMQMVGWAPMKPVPVRVRVNAERR